MIAYHITKKEYMESIWQHGILPCDEIPVGKYSGHRGLSRRISENKYNLFYGFTPVFLTLDVKEAISRIGLRGDIKEWCVIECDTDYTLGRFSFEILTKKVTSSQIRHVTCLSGWI